MAKTINTVLTLKDKISQPLVKVSKNVDKVTREMKKSQNQINRWARNTVKSIDNVVKKSVKAGAAIAAAATGYGIKTAIDLEDAFSGVRKTVDATEEELSQIRTELNNLAMNEIPIAVDEMYGIAEMAGQLGIATENITKFSDTMAKLGVATNMTSEEASTALARLANITQMSQQDFDRLGSTIVELGNNLATTEREIVEMGLRLAGAGKQVGMTEAQILGFAGALSSVGIEAQAGGSAFSKVMVDMQLAVETGSSRLNEFAKIAGMSASEFRKVFQDDAAGAIIAFIEGLSRAEEQGMTAIKILDDMGIKEVRLRDALLRASGASELFRQSIEMGSKAWAENTALQAEAEEKFKNTKSQLQLLKNNITLAADELGQVFLPYINDAIQVAIPFIQKLKESKDSIKELIDNLINLATRIFEFVKNNQTLILTIAGFVGGAYAAIKAIMIVTKVMETWNTLSMLLNGTLKMSSLGWLVIAIGAVVAAGVALYKNWDTIKEKASALSYGVQAAFSNIGTGIINALKGIGNFFITNVINPIIRGLNSLSFTIPSWVPKFGGKTFGFNLKELNAFEYGDYKSLTKPQFTAHSINTGTGVQISAFAKGTSYSPAGYALIHEEGGEIRKLSNGEMIIPADKSERLLRNKSIGDGVNVEVNIYGNVYGEDDLVNKVGFTVYKKIKLALDNM